MSQVERIVIDMEHINPTSAEVAETLKDAMKAAHMSQREMADRTGIPLTTLNRHLNNDGIEWDEIRAIATTLGVSATSIITDTALRVASARRPAA